MKDVLEITYSVQEVIKDDDQTTLEVVRETKRPSGLIVPYGIALVSIESESKEELECPDGLVLPTAEETARYAPSSETDIYNDGEAELRQVGTLGNVYIEVTSFIGVAMKRAMGSIKITTDTNMTEQEVDCITKVAAQIGMRLKPDESSAEEAEDYRGGMYL